MIPTKKERQHDWQKIKDKRTNKTLQNTTQYAEERV